MFYSQFILAKKGPLGTIWIAAHLERKLRKNQVADTDIGVSVDSILAPDVPIALRLSSHLLLGVVRIYSKKVHYLFDDCSDALLKVKQAFRSTAVDLPPEQSKAPYHSITLPETFDLDDFEIPDDELFQGNYVDHHVSAREQITLQDKLEGVAFSTSRFGPDERFGDGDASQIGLDLDEDMFLDQNEVAGTSGVLMDMDVEHPAPLESSSSVKDGGHNEIGTDPSLAASASNFSIQAPSTPGLVEETNLPSAQAPVSDDHMDEDHSPSEFAAKEVSGPSDRQDFPDFGNHDFHADGSCDQQDDEKVRSLGVEHSTETMETFATIETQPLVSDEHAEATVGPDSVGNVVDCNLAENESNVAADIPFEGHSNRVFTPLPNTASVMEVHSENSDKNGVNSRMPETESENMPSFGSELLNLGKTELHIVNSVSELQNGGEAHLNIENSESKSENIPPVDSEVPNLGEIDLNIINSTSECQYKGDPYQNIETSETFGTNMHRKLSAPTIPVLQNCSSLVQNASTEVDGMANTSNFLVEEDKLCSVDIPGKDDYINVSSISTDVQDSMTTNLGTDQPTDQVTDASKNHVDGNLYNKSSVENIFEKENDCKTSDFPAIEKLLSMPNLLTDQHGDLFVESTPIQESTVDADKVVSGRKRSYTESTLTVQSLNSVESFGAAQSKQSGELIPEDDDLLSSILVGKRSTTLKMKPTPPVADTVSTKRRRVAVHSTALKRKVLVDDATVLHGDMIRQQLTSTEDIRRVRTKAPCTRLEIRMLQKQFLEDEIFTEPLFAGMSTDLLPLHYEAFDLGRIKLFEEIKGTDKVVAPAKDTLEVETGNGRPLLGSEATGNDLTSATDPVSEVNCNLEAGNIANSSHLNEIGDVGSMHIDASCQLDDERCEMNSIKEGTSATKDTCGAGNTSQEGVFTTEGLDFDNKSDAECLLEETGGVDKGETGAVHSSTSCQLDDERCEMNSIKEGTSATKDTCGAGNTYQEGVLTTEGLDFDNKSDAECLLEEKGGVDKGETGADIQDNSSLSHDVNVGVSFKDEAIEGCQLGDFVPKDDCSLPVHDDLPASDQRENGGDETSRWNLVDGLELDSLCSVEDDLRSQNTVIAERENPEGWDADPMMSVGPTAVHLDHIYSGDHADYRTEAVEHDTDFLNVDDDAVGEDYESEMPDADEKRILDNTGWSARTRAVANYLQVLFEKEDQHRKKNVSVDSLLAGKSRKEAARMFFETLVLKTKDYIQVEQESPCGDIRINPQCKLLKSEF